MFDPSDISNSTPLTTTSDPVLPSNPISAGLEKTVGQPSAVGSGLTFQFDFEGQVSDELRAATYAAADSWSSVLKDDVVVRLRVESVDLSEFGDLLGGARPAKINVKYEDYADALFKDMTSSNDLLGVNGLQLSAKGKEALQSYQAGKIEANQVKLESKEFIFLMDSQLAKGRSNDPSKPDFIDNNGNNNNKQVQLTRAQAKALNLLDDKENKLDALLTINSNVAWDFDPTDGISPDRYDAVTVMQHEIGHALGIVSGIDSLEFLASTGGAGPVKDSKENEYEKNDFSYLTPMDFYRYSAKSAELGMMDLTIGGGEKYFSLDGGRTAVTDELGRSAYFSTGSEELGGDGYKASHWKTSDKPLGILDPVLQKGRSTDISQLDLTLLDTVGWDLVDTNIERAAAIGIDWTALTSQLASDRKAVVSQLSAQWGDEIPAFEAAVSEAASMLDIKFQQELKEELDDLSKAFEKETDRDKRADKTEKFYKNVTKLAEERNEDLSKLPEKIYKTDKSVQDWLTSPTKKLAKEMQKADGATINRLSNIVKATPAAERTSLEAKLMDATALFADKPNKLVEELLSTSGPANPIGWSYFRWYWWWSTAG